MSVLRDIYGFIYYDIFQGNEALLGSVGTLIWMNLCFWGFNAIPLLSDLLGWPKWMAKYKVQQKVKVPLDRGMMVNAIKVAAFYMIIFYGVFAYPFYILQSNAGISYRVEDVPDWPQLITEVAICILSQEAAFYYSHRLIHHPYLYKRIHKMHHKWTAPSSITSVYAHPIEHLLANVGSVMIGPTLLKCHYFTTNIWVAILTMATTIHHSGYHLPFLPSPQFHDYHHLKTHTNFGTWGLLDWVHGTDSMFDSTIQKKRNWPLCSLTPMSQLIPEESEKKKR